MALGISPDRVRVVIADDHKLVRNALRVALEPDERICIVGEARTGAETLSVVRATAPDVVILDYRLGDADAPEVMDRLREHGLHSKIVILTSYGERRNVRAAVDRGARAFLTKRATDISLLSRVVIDVHEGQAPPVKDALSNLTSDCESDLGSFSSIPPRAREVWRLVALGKSNQTIADELFVTERTVKYHVTNLLAATGARSRAELVSLAYRSGLMDT